MLEDFYQKDEIQIQNFDLFCKILPNNYLICHFLMIFSFILRCQRILACCKINTDERTEVELFYKNRYKFKETYYIKILFFLMCLVTFINFLLNLQFENLILIPYHFKKCINTENLNAFSNDARKSKKENFDFDRNYNLDVQSNFDNDDFFNDVYGKNVNKFDLNYNANSNFDFSNHKDGLSNANINFNNYDNKNNENLKSGFFQLKLKFLQAEKPNPNNTEIKNEKSNNKLSNTSNLGSDSLQSKKKTKLNPNQNLNLRLAKKIKQTFKMNKKGINNNNISETTQDKLNSAEWIILNFIEHITLITYSYFLTINPIKQLIKLELYAFFGVWIIYPNFMRFAQFYLQENKPNLIDNSHWTSYVCVFFLYLCLVINGLIPILTSFLAEKKLNYHFIPKLANNLYLFLSNEVCFFSFYEFVLNSEAENIERFSINSRMPLEANLSPANNFKAKGLFFLGLYTDIMKFKLSYSLEPDDNKVLANARVVYEYFSNANTEIRGSKLEKFFEVEIINKTKSHCLILNQGKFEYEMFDDALAITFKNLYEMFLVYRRSEEFQILVDNLMLNSYIQCKMYNTGLISNF